MSVCVSATEEIVALKRLKMEKEKEGFPITSLREINTLLKAQHPNIVTVRVCTFHTSTTTTTVVVMVVVVVVVVVVIVVVLVVVVVFCCL